MGARMIMAAVVFSVFMGALSHGGWWWAGVAVIAFGIFGGRVRLPLTGVRLSPTDRFILRENRKAAATPASLPGNVAAVPVTSGAPNSTVNARLSSRIVRN